MNGPTVTVLGPPERVDDFLQIFGTDTVPVLQTLSPVRANLPGLGERLVFLLDLDRLDDGQRERLLAYGIERFGLDPDEARRELEEHGFPILAINTTHRYVADWRNIL